MTFDELTETTTRRFGNVLSRRSFIGKVGFGLTAVGAGGMLRVPNAQAAIMGGCCGCPNCGVSTACGTSCPSGTSACGAWYNCECFGYRISRIQDCCGGCGGGCSCGSDGLPSCLYDAPYQSGWQLVKCRAVSCTQITC